MQIRTGARLLAAGALIAAAALAPSRAAAQQFRFGGVPWGISGDSLRPRVEGLGFRHVRTFENGDMRFRSDADVVVQAGFAGGKLVNVMEVRPIEVTAVEARFAAVTDSLKRALGAPGGTRPLIHLWERAFTYLEVSADSGIGGDPPAVRLWYRGPGGDQETFQRLGQTDVFAALDSTWVVLARLDDRRLSLEAASIARRPDGSYRARIRIDHTEIQRDPSGSFDNILYGFDIDCAGRRLQMRSRAAYAGKRQVRNDGGTTVWVPVRRGTFNEALLESVCAYVARK